MVPDNTTLTILKAVDECGQKGGRLNIQDAEKIASLQRFFELKQAELINGVVIKDDRGNIRKVGISGLTHSGRVEMERLSKLKLQTSAIQRGNGCAFISYSVKDKKWGGTIKKVLESLGISAFLAHDDIDVSDEWKDRIVKELGRSDIFIALLSKDFKKSGWCSQEVGFTVPFQEILVIPISIDGTKPFGFISHLQGHQLTTEKDIESALIGTFLRRRRGMIFPKLILKLKSVNGCRIAESAMEPLVPYFQDFTHQEATEFAEAAASNRQIWSAWECAGNYLPRFLIDCGSIIGDDVRVELKRKIYEFPMPELLLHPHGNTMPPSPPRESDSAVSKEVYEQALDLGIRVTRVQLQAEGQMTLSVVDEEIFENDRKKLVTAASKYSYEIVFELGASSVKI